MKTANLILAACIAVGSSAATAQMAETPASGMTPATGATTTQPMQGGAVAQQDRQFVQKAAIGGMFEVQSSQMATTMSTNADVKQFAQMMISDHSKANQELMQIARSKQIPVPNAMDAKHAEMLSKLATTTGQDFDMAYGKAQVKAHKEAIALFEKAAAECEDADLKAFAAKTLPTLKQHLEMAMQLPGAADKNE